MHVAARDVGDEDRAEVGLSGLGADRRELGAADLDLVVAIGELVRERLQRLRHLSTPHGAAYPASFAFDRVGVLDRIPPRSSSASLDCNREPPRLAPSVPGRPAKIDVRSGFALHLLPAGEGGRDGRMRVTGPAWATTSGGSRSRSRGPSSAPSGHLLPREKVKAHRPRRYPVCVIGRDPIDPSPRATSTRSTRLPSMSTTSNVIPPHSNRSATEGMRPNRVRTNPANVS